MKRSPHFKQPPRRCLEMLCCAGKMGPLINVFRSCEDSVTHFDIELQTPNLQLGFNGLGPNKGQYLDQYEGLQSLTFDKKVTEGHHTLI